MSQQYARPLNSPELVENFLANALNFSHKNLKKIIPKIVDGEIGVANIAKSPQTLTSTNYRTKAYRDELVRWELRKKIITELSTQKRPSSDDKIRLNYGGALPTTPVKSKKQAFILIGPPASGKSGIAEKIADSHGSVIIDSDYAKRKLPEFHEFPYGASLVHEESSAITYGLDNVYNPDNVKSLYEVCLDKNYNLIIPKIGNNSSSILSLAETLKDKRGYDVHLILVALSKRKATIRAIFRFYETKRYVPLSLIFDGYGNDSWLTYFYLRCKYESIFKSFGAISTDVNRGEEGIGFDVVGRSPVLKFKFEEVKLLWQ